MLTEQIAPDNTGENRDENGRFLPGKSGNLSGRPRDSISIKSLIRKHLEENPEDLKEFVNYFVKNKRELAWQMLEGRPFQSSNISGELGLPVRIIEVIIPDADTN